MPIDSVTNFGKCAVSTGYDAAATAIVLAAGSGANLPNPSVDGAFNATWYNSTDYFDPSDDPFREVIRVTARTTDTLGTIIRGQEGTAASAKNIAGKTYLLRHGLTAKTISDIKNMHVENEVPSGAVDGVNADFTLANTPITGSVKLYRNGARQISGFSIAGGTITFNAGNLPQTGDELLADYRK